MDAVSGLMDSNINLQLNMPRCVSKLAPPARVLDSNRTLSNPN